MRMNNIDMANVLLQRLPQTRRPVQPSPTLRGKIADADAIQRDRDLNGHVADASAIDICGEYLDIMSQPGQRPTQRVNGENRATIPHGRPIGWDYMQNAHKLLESV